jgi:hypothetical protein
MSNQTEANPRVWNSNDKHASNKMSVTYIHEHIPTSTLQSPVHSTIFLPASSDHTSHFLTSVLVLCCSGEFQSRNRLITGLKFASARQCANTVLPTQGDTSVSRRLSTDVSQLLYLWRWCLTGARACIICARDPPRWCVGGWNHGPWLPPPPPPLMRTSLAPLTDRKPRGKGKLHNYMWRLRALL